MFWAGAGMGLAAISAMKALSLEGILRHAARGARNRSDAKLSHLP